MNKEVIKNLGQAYLQVQENQKAALQKKLAKSAQSSEKGKAAVTLSKPPFEIPEDVPVDERDMFMAKAAAAHKAGKSHFTMPGGKKHPVTMKKDTAKAVNNEAADLNKDNADKAIKHDCATHVEHAQWGKGTPISEQHTIIETAPGEGYVSHYDVMFEHGIEKNVAVEDLNILAEMSHGHAKKKSKNEMSSKEKMKRGLYNITNEADDATVRMMKDNPKMRAQDGPGGMKSLDRKAHTAVRKALQKKNEEDVVMNPKKEKKQTQPDMSAASEAVIYNRIMEARKMKATADKGGEHTKSATDQEEMGDKMASSKGAMDMMNTPKEIKDNPEASGDEVKKEGAAGPKAAMRKGDNAAGDKKIIPSATPMKGM